MRLAQIIGQVVATVRNPTLGMDKLLLVQFLDGEGNLEQSVHVAVDNLGAGNGEWVLIVSGSSARLSVGRGDSGAGSAVDLCVVGIVDQVTSAAGLNFRKDG
jgi:ethanolamine utilization protein EutN